MNTYLEYELKLLFNLFALDSKKLKQEFLVKICVHIVLDFISLITQVVTHKDNMSRPSEYFTLKVS